MYENREITYFRFHRICGGICGSACGNGDIAINRNVYNFKACRITGEYFKTAQTVK